MHALFFFWSQMLWVFSRVLDPLNANRTAPVEHRCLGMDSHRSHSVKDSCTGRSLVRLPPPIPYSCPFFIRGVILFTDCAASAWAPSGWTVNNKEKDYFPLSSAFGVSPAVRSFSTVSASSS